jgi:16S rRNA (guanine(966)-N(2))-methyltransferase RsmD
VGVGTLAGAAGTLAGTLSLTAGVCAASLCGVSAAFPPLNRLKKLNMVCRDGCRGELPTAAFDGAGWRAAAHAPRWTGNAAMRSKRGILPGAPPMLLAAGAAAVVTLAGACPYRLRAERDRSQSFVIEIVRMSRSSAPRAPSTRGATSARGKPHTVRIIGGDWKRTPLQVLDLEGLRPTPDRVRETLFNWLGQRLDGWRCLDLFAGTGALGFEAASRGGARVLMVERNAKAARQLREIRERLSAQAVEVVEADGLRLAAGLPPRAFDVVFLDPPFGEQLLPRAMESAAPLVADDGYLYVESGEELDVASVAALAGWRIVKQGKAGAVYYHLLQRENDE